MKFLLKLFGIDKLEVKFNFDEVVSEIEKENPRLASITQEAVDNIKRISSELKETFEEFDFEDIFVGIGLVRDLALSVIVVTEAYSRLMSYDDDLTSKEKLQTAVKWLDDAIEVPGILEHFDGKAIEYIISTGVSKLNGVFGENFIDEFADDLGKYRELLQSRPIT